MQSICESITSHIWWQVGDRCVFHCVSLLLLLLLFRIRSDESPAAQAQSYNLSLSNPLSAWCDNVISFSSLFSCRLMSHSLCVCLYCMVICLTDAGFRRLSSLWGWSWLKSVFNVTNLDRFPAKKKWEKLLEQQLCQRSASIINRNTYCLVKLKEFCFQCTDFYNSCLTAVYLSTFSVA